MSRVSQNLYNANITDLTVTFTTDNPNITPDSIILIADGDANPTATVTNNTAVECANKINAILDALRTVGVLNGDTTSTAVSGAYVPAAAPAAFAVTYTTDAPSISPNSALVIADGDAATVTRAEYNELAEEFEASFNALRTALINAGVLV